MARRYAGENPGKTKNQGEKGRLSVEQMEDLPVYHRETITEEYLDAMGHMNVRWYMALYDEATWRFFTAIGMTADYFDMAHAGAFALKQFLSYFSEIQAGRTVALRTRVLGRSEKRFHFMHFMVDETAGMVASSFESLGTHADLKRRRSMPFPDYIASELDARIAADSRLDWEAPACGILHP